MAQLSYNLQCAGHTNTVQKRSLQQLMQPGVNPLKRRSVNWLHFAIQA